MAPKFGNYLFRNLRTSAGGAAEPALADPEAALAGTMIRLGPSDFIGTGEETSGVLNWSAVESKEIFVPFSDTRGLAQGRITISADALRKANPALVPVDIPAEKPFLLSLRGVVLQVQRFLRPASNLVGPPLGPDFDTPISQVAREDENFHQLEPNPIGGPERRLGVLDAVSPDNQPGFPLIREKPKAPDVDPQNSVAGPTADASSRETGPGQDPFADLPQVGPTQASRPIAVQPERKPLQLLAETRGMQSTPTGEKPVRRVALERLQELFLTDDYLDAKMVAQLLRAFPKVQAVLIMQADGSVLGGELPTGWNLEAARATPALLRQVQAYSDSLAGRTAPGCMLLGNIPVSLFLEGGICLLLVHGGRGLLPGMKERITEIAKALSAFHEASSTVEDD